MATPSVLRVASLRAALSQVSSQARYHAAAASDDHLRAALRQLARLADLELALDGDPAQRWRVAPRARERAHEAEEPAA